MPKKYLLKIGPQLKVVSSKQFDNISLNEALLIGISSSEEQKKQLIKDAIGNERSYYGHKVVASLEVSLTKLEEKFPEIRSQIKKLISLNQSN